MAANSASAMASTQNDITMSVRLLVLAAELECQRVEADDRVAERHGRESAAPSQPSRESAVEFQRPCGTGRRLPSTASARRPPARPGSWRGPGISQETRQVGTSGPRAGAGFLDPGGSLANDRGRVPSSKPPATRVSKNNSREKSNPPRPCEDGPPAPEIDRMNPRRLFVASCIALVASAFSFIFRQDVLPAWGRSFDLNAKELGLIRDRRSGGWRRGDGDRLVRRSTCSG